MLPDRVSNPGPLTYESGALPIALRGPGERERERERVRKSNANTVGPCHIILKLVGRSSTESYPAQSNGS